MRFTSVLFAGVFALAANAQSPTTPTTSVTMTATSTSPAQSSANAIDACLNACDESDVNCKAKCIAVPSPDTTAVNETNQCVADCPKGDGSKAGNDAYQTCVNQCIGEYYYTTTGTPNQSASTGTADMSGSMTMTSGGSASTTPTTTSMITTTFTSGSQTFTSTGAAPTSTSGANTDNSSGDNGGTGAGSALANPMTSAAGLIGLLCVALAL